MNKATKDNQNIAEWRGNQLYYSSYNEYRHGNPVEDVALTMCDPTFDDFCYWCAIGGTTFALRPVVGETCIATVENALRAQTSIQYGSGLYVIWQPNVHSISAWTRWQKKWSVRTLTLD